MFNNFDGIFFSNKQFILRGLTVVKNQNDELPLVNDTDILKSFLGKIESRFKPRQSAFGP